MGGCLFAAAVASSMTAGEFLSSTVDVVYKIILVALGLGMVIFVHELGHFAVAKWCGVKCEKFYLGFDIWGKKFFSFQWGETEYGIGVLPLGGYVKMLGQDDNPNRQADEIKRSQIDPSKPAEKNIEGSAAAAEAAVAADLKGEDPQEPLDPRSYLAKSVPARMAIISAGVIMNMIFAFFVFMIAYSMGVTYMPPHVSYVVPGQPAWVAGIEAGDEIFEIGGKRARTFDDIFEEVMLSNRDNVDGVPITVHRPDPTAPDGYREIKFKIPPNRNEERPRIGVAPAQDTKLLKAEPVNENTPAATVSSLKFEGGDNVVAINDTDVKTYAQMRTALARNASKPINVKVERLDKETGKAKVVSIPVAVRPMKTLGVVVALGTVTAVKVDSAAEKAGLVKGDLLVSFAGEAVGDPMTLAERVFRQAGTETQLVVQRGNNTITLNVTPADIPPSPDPVFGNGPVEISALGITCQLHSRIAKVVPDSPAAKAAGGKSLEGSILSVEIVPDEKGKADEDLISKRFGIKEQKIKLAPEEGSDEPKHGWAFVFHRMQLVSPGTEIKLTLEGNVEVQIKPAESSDFFLADRGLNCDVLKRKMRAATTGEAMDMTGRKIWGTIGTIYRFLSKLSDPQIAKNAGGPVQIAAAAYNFASMGFSDFLLFLGMLSVNLAVINFLPIPVLDGGHMVFLAYEGIRGKPVPERGTFLLHMAGLALILCLVVLVFTLDGRFAFRMWQNW